MFDTASTEQPQQPSRSLSAKTVFKLAASAGLYSVLIWSAFAGGRLPVFLAFMPLLFFADAILARCWNIQPELMKLEPVPTENLPAAVRAYFEAHTPEFERANFSLLGDFQLKRHSQHYTRFFAHQDGTIFGEITSRSMIVSPVQACAIFSITPDLAYFETGNIRVPKDKPHPRFVLRGVPGASLDELLVIHQQLLVDHAGGEEPALAFEARDLEAICLYGQKMLYDSLVRQGIASSNPYADIRVPAEPVPCFAVPQNSP